MNMHLFCELDYGLVAQFHFPELKRKLLAKDLYFIAFNSTGLVFDVQISTAFNLFELLMCICQPVNHADVS